MNEITHCVNCLQKDGINVIQVANVTRITTDNESVGIDGKVSSPGKYTVLDVRVLIPVGE